ncbi:MAG: helix-turn-helix transcriptional regulator [Oscillospiraceae bacterium]|nr:helix-turn-helix transcriptional regulator [Oscillospiraceae bacterium]
MELNEKLQELRKQKGITQGELAEQLYVSRTAVSKWESGRGYPNIDSLKAIARFFGITVDQLLSGEELLAIAEEDGRQKENRVRDLTFGLLDISIAMLFFLPFFGHRADGAVEGSSLLALAEMANYLKIAYYTVVIGMILTGILTLALQNCGQRIWIGSKRKLSLLLNTAGVVLFTVSLQPYAATFLLILLVIKALMLIKWQ